MRCKWMRGLAFFTVAILMWILLPLSAAAVGVEAYPLSHGLLVLAEEMDVALSGMVGNELSMDAECFERGLNLATVHYLKIESLPAVTEGELLLSSTRVVVGQTVARENLRYLNFVPATDDVRQASFEFSVNGANVPLTCQMYLLTESNTTPTLGMIPTLSRSLSTYRNIAAYGKMSAYDPDGDALTYEIVTYPQHGALTLLNRGEGTYRYTPADGYVGEDCFSYVARDLYGNYSSSTTVEMSVSLSGTSITYADMASSDAYNDALLLTERGIMSGTQIGSLYYFMPNESVSRAEFLVMAMHAAGIDDPPTCERTCFADDAEIPVAMKGYVDMAYALGYINGRMVDGALCFVPEAEINRAEAAVILSSILGVSDVSVTPVFTDTSEIPAWARTSVYALYTVGILDTRDGYIAPASTVTREQASEMLAAVIAFVERSEK